ncbi:type 1 fimbrial protein [Pseudomonas sp. B21-012]|uniref:fimbrial protein n=1 Tax=Pseudomonas sp. B21-012 TaxID=2895472 RepID=UPI00215EBB88|nr:fimbrial protein [Pseudomonas sp. B21-012]UVM58464.1 type 1 fimbrial protein [Pseudomonas sp. B21-012]
MKQWARVVIAFFATASWLSTTQALEHNFYISGVLVNEPCTLAVEDGLIELDFLSVSDKDLYLNSRTRGNPLVLHLQNCDPTIASHVSIIFSGVESANLPGLLKLEDGKSRGLAIGLESQQSNPLLLNKIHHMADLAEGNNEVYFKAFLQAEPDTLIDRAIGLGSFFGSLTFTLIYE